MVYDNTVLGPQSPYRCTSYAKDRAQLGWVRFGRQLEAVLIPRGQVPRGQGDAKGGDGNQRSREEATDRWADGWVWYLPVTDPGGELDDELELLAEPFRVDAGEFDAAVRACLDTNAHRAAGPAAIEAAFRTRQKSTQCYEIARLRGLSGPDA